MVNTRCLYMLIQDVWKYTKYGTILDFSYIHLVILSSILHSISIFMSVLGQLFVFWVVQTEFIFWYSLFPLFSYSLSLNFWRLFFFLCCPKVLMKFVFSFVLGSLNMLQQDCFKFFFLQIMSLIMVHMSEK